MIHGSFWGGEGGVFGPPRISDPRTTYCTVNFHASAYESLHSKNAICAREFLGVLPIKESVVWQMVGPLLLCICSSLFFVPHCGTIRYATGQEGKGYPDSG